MPFCFARDCRDHRWWAQFGKEHPEWFALRADGKRGLKGAAGRCVDSAVRLQSRDAPFSGRPGLGWRRRVDIGGRPTRPADKHVPLSAMPGSGTVPRKNIFRRI